VHHGLIRRRDGGPGGVASGAGDPAHAAMKPRF
jgi:hypothetical protein